MTPIPLRNLRDDKDSFSPGGLDGEGYATWDGATPGGIEAEQKELGEEAARVF